jgi:hypothetical protein
VKRGAFKKDAAHDHHEIAHGIDQRQFLNDRRHVENGSSETGKNNARNQKHKRPQQSLLLGYRQRRDHQPHADGRKQKQNKTGIQRRQAPQQRYLKPEDRYQYYQRRFGNSDDKARNRFADKDLPGAIGRHQQLIKGSLLALACHRKRCNQHGYHQGQQPHDARNDKPARSETRCQKDDHRPAIPEWNIA